MTRHRNSRRRSIAGKSAAAQAVDVATRLPQLTSDPKFFAYGCDCALAGIIFVMPIIMGGRHPLGRLVYLALVATLAICWIAASRTQGNQKWHSSRVEWLLLAGGLVGLLQILRLPPSVLEFLSPYQAELLPQWSTRLVAALGLQPWNQVSLTPQATWLGLGMFVAHAVLFTILVQRFQDLDQIRRLLHWVALAALSMAIFGLLQYASGTERFSWVFEHYSRPANIDVTGPFVNSNHFAHYLALGIGPLVWWLLGFNRQAVAGPTGNTFSGKKTNESLFPLVAGAALSTVALAGLLAKSRGGMLVMFLALLVSVTLFVRLRLLTHRAWYVLAGMAIVVVAGLGIHGYEQVQDELASMTSVDSIDRSAARRQIWSANLEIARRFPVLGTGIGSHGEIYQRFFPHYSLVHYSHAESSYLQVLSETGFAGAGLVLFGIGYLLKWLRDGLRASSSQVATYTAAIAAGLAVSLTHAIFDFPWHIPSCIALAIMMAAAACGLSQHAQQQQADDLPLDNSRAGRLAAKKSKLHRPVASESIPWFGWGAVALLLVCVHAHLGPALGGADWIRYRKTSLQSKSVLHEQLATSKAQTERQEKLDHVMFDAGRRMASQIERVLKHDPDHLHAHARMAMICLQLFNHAQLESDNAMDLSQIRDAAVASRFESRAALDNWLGAAVGDHRRLLDKARYHALRALQICPLDGRVYLNLSELAFLDGLSSAGSHELAAAAMRVRPYDGAVLFTVGREAALAGDTEGALTLWRRSFQYSREYRIAIMNALAPNIPPAFFVNHFEPDESGLESLLALYRSRELIPQARIIAPLVLKNLASEASQRSGIPAANVWHKARDLYRYLGDTENSLQCARQAVSAAPNWYTGRIALAEELMALERFEEAIPEYTWCKRRRPFDKLVRQRLAVIDALQAKQFGQQQIANSTTNQPLVPPSKF